MNNKIENSKFILSTGSAVLLAGIMALLPTAWQACFGIAVGAILMIAAGVMYEKAKASKGQ